ncbi:GNAT family N-acetyltransferase [Halobacillus massiliensis]|uniref:GNAT family N-acetyltransferase n=1 Tax=Halobacillus massiliensis TaxID=1926286 RepID=UPI0009E4E625|nr:GNAT family N-acetyltransferase [Halobacillus massiliensis]
MEVREIKTREELEQAFEIRKCVFVQEQNVPIEDEFDEWEEAALHVLASYKNTPAGAGRIRFFEKTAKLERICILPAFRKNGIGKAIIHTLEKIARDKGCVKVILHGQVQAAGFYRKLNYSIDSKEFFEDGIAHYVMVKNL